MMAFEDPSDSSLDQTAEGRRKKGRKFSSSSKKKKKLPKSRMSIEISIPIERKEYKPDIEERNQVLNEESIKQEAADNESLSLEDSLLRKSSDEHGQSYNQAVSLQIPGIRAARENVVPILETHDEQVTTPHVIARKKNRYATEDPANNLQSKIRDRIKESEVRRQSQTGLFTHRSSRGDLKEIFQPDSPVKRTSIGDQNRMRSTSIENELESPTKKKKFGYFENFAKQQIKYIRLMKMMKVETSKVQGLETHKRDLVSVLRQDDMLLEHLRDAMEDIRNEGSVDKGKLVKLIRSIDSRKKAVSGIKNKNFLKVEEGYGTTYVHSKLKANQDTASDAQPQESPEKSPRNQPTSGQVLPEEETKKHDSGQKPFQRKGDHKPTQLRTGLNMTSMIAGLTTTIGAAPVLGRRRDNSKKPVNPMIDLRAKLDRALAKPSIKNPVSMKKILKSITGFYVDKITGGKDSVMVRDQDMCSFVYSSLLNTYGLPKFAESKFLKLMTSIKKYANINRIGVFAKFCGLMEAQDNWRSDECKQYLLGLEVLLTQQNIGMTIPNAEHDRRHYTPVIRALEYARQYCEKRGLQLELVEIKRQVEKNKESDESGQNRSGKIRIDYFMPLMVEVYQSYKKKHKELLKRVFDSCNFDGNVVLSIDEFSVLVKNIEPEYYDPRKIEELYNANEELVDAENTGIPLDKFVVLALDYEMFSTEKQKRFALANDDKDIKRNFKTLKEIWPEKMERLKHLIDYNQRDYEDETITFWTTALRSLDEDMKCFKEDQYLTALMKYRILILEMNNSFGVNVPTN